MNFKEEINNVKALTSKLEGAIDEGKYIEAIDMLSFDFVVVLDPIIGKLTDKVYGKYVPIDERGVEKKKE